MALLFGRTVGEKLTVTDMLVPEQEADGSLVNSLSSVGISTFKNANDVELLGWVHTHPAYDSYMSSCD